MIGLAQVPYQDLGSECSGVVKAVGKSVTHLDPGDRVCGLSSGTFGSRTRTTSLLVSKIPEELSFSTAATIPVIFCTALYSLQTIGRLDKGESILIHAAAGGVGQAAIMLSQFLGAEVFVTLSSAEKKDFVKKVYGIPESHIFSSRDTTFESGILRATNNKGVDVILNSIAGEGLKASWRCIAPLGRFVEIGKADLVQNSYLDMKRFLGSVTFAGVDLTVVAKHKPEIFNKLLTEVLELYQSSAIRAVSPITCFGMSEIQNAMRLMQGGKHMGKIIIQGQSNDIVQVIVKSYLAGGWIDTDTRDTGSAISNQHDDSASRCVLSHNGRHWRNWAIIGILACQERRQKYRARLAQWFGQQFSPCARRGCTDPRHWCKHRSSNMRCWQSGAVGRPHQRDSRDNATNKGGYSWCHGPPGQLMLSSPA